jgi:hypothetical protein
MHTVERLEQAIALAGELGFIVRQDWFGGLGGGACELKGRRWLLVDLALSPAEQLDLVLDALASGADIAGSVPSPQMQKLLNLRKTA